MSTDRWRAFDDRWDLPEYRLIEKSYRKHTSRRTQQPYMKHIDQGLWLLLHVNDDPAVLGAWCAHPLFQINSVLQEALHARTSITEHGRTVVLAMEYRAVANAFLTPDWSRAGLPRVSAIEEVNQLLVVDKFQNAREAYLFSDKLGEERCAQLDVYFRKWFDALGIDGRRMETLERQMQKYESYPWRPR